MLNNDNVAVEGNRKELILKILALKGECVKEIERKNEFKQKLDHLLFYWNIQKCEFKVWYHKNQFAFLRIMSSKFNNSSTLKSNKISEKDPIQ